MTRPWRDIYRVIGSLPGQGRLCRRWPKPSGQPKPGPHAACHAAHDGVQVL